MKCSNSDHSSSLIKSRGKLISIADTSLMMWTPLLTQRLEWC